MTLKTRGAAACLLSFALLALPGCAIVEEAFGGSDTPDQTQTLEPSAPPHSAATRVHVTDVQEAQPSLGAMSEGTPPLVVIRFDKEDVAYEKPLYEAMNATLAQDPEATFYVIAIAPPKDTAVQLASVQAESAEHVKQVVKAMTKMGLPASRITVASTTNAIARVSEVRVFVQ